MKALLFLGFIVSVGCYDPHAQESSIVREVEANGSGNISTYTLPGLGEWFSHRPTLATRIATECSLLSLNRGANWATSAEGTVCSAAAVTAPPPDLKADSRIW